MDLQPPPPTLSYDANKTLPIPQLRSLRTHIHTLRARIAELHATIHGYGDPNPPFWPDILTKYNNILQQTALISEQLSVSMTPAGSLAAAVAASQAQSENWPRPPHNSLTHLLIHPLAPVPLELNNYVGNLVHTNRSPDVITRDDQAAAAFQRSLDQAPQDVVDDMRSIRDEHDARASRALRAVEMLREHFPMRARPDFSQEMDQDQDKVEREGASPDNESAEEEVEQQVQLDRDPSISSQQSHPLNDGGVEPNDEGPDDDIDDLFEEVA
ncbi:hypothetical protein FRC04_009737 [Tulasnella sp. 424]|nr:hypothetical protein FRC04_009737 [Tulasnella sp. 424]KAG8973155.1 hypothetical protein FRC05_009015 [Tulasnella sp. 425]